MLEIKLKFKATCPRHVRYNPEKDEEGGIRAGCSICHALMDVWVTFQKLQGFCEKAKNLIGVPKDESSSAQP